MTDYICPLCTANAATYNLRNTCCARRLVESCRPLKQQAAIMLHVIERQGGKEMRVSVVEELRAGAAS